MSVSTANTVGRQAGLAAVLAVFVCLVTFTFSFLGTILCAALFGMMVGFGRKWSWQAVAISLLFPGALLASLHVFSSKSELSWLDGARLASVCFGTFWVTCLATRGLLLLEGAPREAPAARRPAAPAAGDTAAAAVAWHEVQIGELQGVWSQEVPSADGRASRRVLKVEGRELTVSRVGENGRPQSLGKGQLQLVKLGQG
jgi:hypothetical protein